MKRTLVGALVALVIIALLGAARVNVTNPMTANLDAGGNNITNAANFITANGAVLGGDSVLAHAYVFSTNSSMTPPFTLDFATTGDPMQPDTIEQATNPGNLLRRLLISNGQVVGAELWFKTGPLTTDWVRIAPQ